MVALFNHCCRLGRILATLLQLINYLPGGGTWRWLHCSTIVAGRVGKNIGNPIATGYSLAWWRKLGMVACSTIAAGQVGNPLAIDKLLAWWRNLEMVALFHHCCRTGWDIGNPLAIDKLLAWWRNLEMVALFHHCCRTGWEEYWQPSCN